MRTLTLVGGTHTSRTAPFIRACVAYCFITIPSIDSLFVRLDLYLTCGNVALLNGAVGQAEDLFKASVVLFGEIPAHPGSLEMEAVRRRCKETEQKIASFVTRFASILVVIPGHPELGPFYLFGGLVKVLTSFQWMPGSDVPCRLYMSLLSTLCAMAQDEFIYHIPNLDSNDVLYGGDPLYLDELNKQVDELVKQVLDQLTALKSADPELQSELSAEFFDLTVSLADLNPKSGNLAASLFNFAKEHPSNYLKNAHAALKYREGPLYQQMLTKLSVK